MTTKVLAYADSIVPGRPIEHTVFRRVTFPRAGNNQLTNNAITFSEIQDPTAEKRAVRRWDVAKFKAGSGWSGSSKNLVRIGHSLFALLAAWLGGRLSRRLCQSSRQAEASTTVESGA